MATSNLIAGLIILILGIAGKLFVGRREFYRRNEAGVEEFKSYTSAVASTTIERIISFISGIAVVLGLIAIVISFLQR